METGLSPAMELMGAFGRAMYHGPRGWHVGCPCLIYADTCSTLCPCSAGTPEPQLDDYLRHLDSEMASVATPPTASAYDPASAFLRVRLPLPGPTHLLPLILTNSPVYRSALF